MWNCYGLSCNSAKTKSWVGFQVPFNAGTSELLFRRPLANFRRILSSFRQLPPPSLFALWTWTPPDPRNGDDSIASLRHAICVKHARSNATAPCLARTASARTTAIRAHSPGPNLAKQSPPRIHQLVAEGMHLERQHLRRHTRCSTQTLPLLRIPNRMSSTPGTRRRRL